MRRLLRLRPGGLVTFVIDGDHVCLVRSGMTLEEAFGSVTPINRPENFNELIRQAKEEHAERTMRKMRER